MNERRPHRTRNELVVEVALEVLARVIEILVHDGLLDGPEVLELVELAKRHMREPIIPPPP
jgi:hypothetical protein